MPRDNADAGRPPRRNGVALEEDILDAVAADPTRSTRGLAREFNTSAVNAWNILNKDGQHPFHYRRVQSLKERDPAQRLVFCQEFIECAENHPTYVDRIVWTDESIFTREGIFNQHNSHIWSHENPCAIHEKSFQDRFSINIWAAMVGDNLVRTP